MKNKIRYAFLLPLIMFSLYICGSLQAQTPEPPPMDVIADAPAIEAPAVEAPLADVVEEDIVEEEAIIEEPVTIPTPVVTPTTLPAVEPTTTDDVTTDSDDDSSEMTFVQPEDTDEQITSSTNNLISITLNNVPLTDVVRMFTLVSGANIVANSDTLTGTVTVNLKDVEWKPALNSILDMHGFSIVEKELNSGVYSIVQRPLDAPIPMVTKSFQLKFATVKDISPIVRNMLSPGGSLNEFSSRNMLVVRSTSESLSAIDTIIKEIDQPTKQVCVETKFIELRDNSSKQLGIRWDALESFNMNLQAGPFAVTRQTLDTLSRRDEQTQYDRKSFEDISDQQYNEFGVPTPNNEYRTINDTIAKGIENRQEITKSFNEAIDTTQAAILEMDQFQIVLSALHNTDGASLVSNTKIIVANGATNALFSVGDREPIIRTEVQRGTTDSPGDIITAELDTAINTDYISQGYLATGIDLRVIPVVKTDNLIEAEIIPSLRRKTGEKEVGGNSWPVISVKEIRTRFTLLSGQTVAIGGLTDTGDEKLTSKIPLLGDIPLLGKYLFSHSKKVKAQVETIIFVTLSIANPDQLNDNVGIPEYGSLIHKRLITDKIRRQEMEADVQELQNSVDMDQQERARDMRTDLLRRQ